VPRLSADWEQIGRAAGSIRNTLMSWYGKRLLAFWDGQSRGAAHMIDTARRDGLGIRVIPVQIGIAR